LPAIRAIFYLLMTNERIAIAGIHTGIGKTIASAVVAEALGFDYWKPVQAGLEERDAALLAQLLTNGTSRVHPEAYLLREPMSPHAAAALEGIEIDLAGMPWPQTGRGLIVETAGGLHSPMTATATMADFIAYHKLPSILISQNYLGSINHTLLTIEVMRSRGIPLLGIIINGSENAASESFISAYSGITPIGRIPHFSALNNAAISASAATLRPALQQMIQHAHHQ